jgi:hypothetical protein
MHTNEMNVFTFKSAFTCIPRFDIYVGLYVGPI